MFSNDKFTQYEKIIQKKRIFLTIGKNIANSQLEKFQWTNDFQRRFSMNVRHFKIQKSYFQSLWFFFQ